MEVIFCASEDKVGRMAARKIARVVADNQADPVVGVATVCSDGHLRSARRDGAERSAVSDEGREGARPSGVQRHHCGVATISAHREMYYIVATTYAESECPQPILSFGSHHHAGPSFDIP